MKIVIIGIDSNYSSINSFIYTIAKYLCRELGHEVHCVIPEQHNAKYCAMLKNAVKGNLRKAWSGPADVFIFNHSFEVNKYKSWSGKKVLVMHNSTTDLPKFSVDKVVCLSDSSYNLIDHKNKYRINSPIDLERFTPRKPISDELQKVLVIAPSNANYYTVKIQAACSKIGVYCQVLGANTFGDQTRFDVETIINTADLVIGYGRSIYEAMACGRPVIVYGVNGGDGYLSAEIFTKSYSENCSGVGVSSMPKPKDITVNQIVDELIKYQSSHGHHNYNIAKQFDIKHNIQLLIN